MLPKDTPIFASFHPDDEKLVLPVLEQVRAAGWENIPIRQQQADRTVVTESIQKSGMVLVFLSKEYARDDSLMLEEFAYSATVERKPFIPVWLDSLAEIRQDDRDAKLLSTLELLTAKHRGMAAEQLIATLEQSTPDDRPYMPSTPQICEKPCEAYEGDEPYLFISYAHDDARQVYPV